MAVLDKSQRTQKYSGALFLANAGIPVYIDSQHAVSHNEVVVLDRSTLITGSFNFTKAAEEKECGEPVGAEGEPGPSGEGT